MPLVPIDISGGAFRNVDTTELNNSKFAAELKNILLSDSGGNIGRPGLTLVSGALNYPVIGLCEFGGSLVVVTQNRSIYAINASGGVVNITGASELPGTARPVFASDGTYLAIAGGAAPIRWNGTGVTELMPGSPPNCTHISYLDSYWLIHLLADQEFRWAGPTAAARESWSASNYVSAERLPDNLTSQAVLLRELYGFGVNSVEIYQNFGDSVTPFKPTFFIDRGTSSPYSVVQADNTLWWLDSDRRFVKLEGRTPALISSPYDKVINGLTTVSDAWGAVININGFYLIAWTFPTEERTFVFDYKNQHWSEWDGFSGSESDRFRIHSHAYVASINRHYRGDPDLGRVWRLDPSAHSDGTLPRRVLRRTGFVDHGTGTRKRSNYYLFHVKRGVGTSGSTEPYMMVRFNDDNNGWSDYINVGLGNPGSDQMPIRVHLRGIYRRRQLEFSMTDNAEFILSKVEESIEPMES